MSIYTPVAGLWQSVDIWDFEILIGKIGEWKFNVGIYHGSQRDNGGNSLWLVPCGIAIF